MDSNGLSSNHRIPTTSSSASITDDDWVDGVEADEISTSEEHTGVGVEAIVVELIGDGTDEKGVAEDGEKGRLVTARRPRRRIAAAS